MLCGVLIIQVFIAFGLCILLCGVPIILERALIEAVKSFNSR
ncbi:hypothetical protein OROHE_004622 [Orobanche hederae]